LTVTDEDHRCLREAVLEAGAIALRRQSENIDRWEKGRGQVVTEADLEIDAFLHDRIALTHPADGWLSEERPDDLRRLQRHRVWMADPIDGTRAYAQGRPQFTVCAALVVDGHVQLGVIYNPATDELFEARAGEGASLNGAPILTGCQETLVGAKLLSSRGEMSRRWERWVPEASFTAVGSIAYKLALVACGRFDGLMSLRPTNDWDIAAADLLLQEAGAVLTNADGYVPRYNTPDARHHGLAAGPKKLHAKLVARLAKGREPG
jgi:myo-inositol-1(or 4)-monophosphatase